MEQHKLKQGTVEKFKRGIAGGLLVIVGAATLSACGASGGRAPTLSSEPTISTPGASGPVETASPTPTPVETPESVSSIDPPEVLDPANNPAGLRTETYRYTVGGEALSYGQLVERWSLRLADYPTPVDVNKRLAEVIGEYMNTGCAAADDEQAPFGVFTPTSALSTGCASASYYFYGNAFKQALTGTTGITFDDQAMTALFNYHASLASWDHVALGKGDKTGVTLSVRLEDQTVVGNGKEPKDEGYAADTVFGVTMKDDAGTVNPAVAESRKKGGLPINFHNLFRWQGELTIEDGKWRIDTLDTREAKAVKK